MTNQSKIFIAVAFFAVVGIGYSVSTSSTPNTTVAVVANDNEMTESIPTQEATTEVGDMETNQEMKQASEADTVTTDVTKGGYLDYDAGMVAASNAEHIVLNFSATWCPSCRAFDVNVNENLSAIPDGVEMYKVNYDSNVALRKQYGVTTQHTFVVINADGTMIQKWSGGNTLESVLVKL